MRKETVDIDTPKTRKNSKTKITQLIQITNGLHRCFPANFAKFLKHLFLQNASGRLLLNVNNINLNSQSNTYEAGLEWPYFEDDPSITKCRANSPTYHFLLIIQHIQVVISSISEDMIIV